MRKSFFLLSFFVSALALRIHMIGLFHTVTSSSYSHCAFTGKVLRFPSTVQPFGHQVIEYGNGQSESGAHRFIQILTEEELTTLLPPRETTETYAKHAVIGSPAHRLFEERLLPLLLQELQPGDILCHPFGITHRELALEKLPSWVLNVECGIGYVETWAPYRIFESRAKLHYTLGMQQSPGKQYDFVIPNYFNISEWPEPCCLPWGWCHTDRFGPLVYMGRISSEKGMSVIRALAEALPEREFKVAGQGDFDQFFSDLPNVKYYGPLIGRERVEFLRGAAAMLMPTLYVEPFGGSGVEAQLMGIPLLASHFGAFSETLRHGVTGFLCRTLGDWLAAIEQAPTLSSYHISSRARELYSQQRVGSMYDRAFRIIQQLQYDGWYNKTSLQLEGQLFV